MSLNFSVVIPQVNVTQEGAIFVYGMALPFVNLLECLARYDSMEAPQRGSEPKVVPWWHPELLDRVYRKVTNRLTHDTNVFTRFRNFHCEEAHVSIMSVVCEMPMFGIGDAVPFLQPNRLAEA